MAPVLVEPDVEPVVEPLAAVPVVLEPAATLAEVEEDGEELPQAATPAAQRSSTKPSRRFAGCFGNAGRGMVVSRLPAVLTVTDGGRT